MKTLSFSLCTAAPFPQKNPFPIFLREWGGCTQANFLSVLEIFISPLDNICTVSLKTKCTKRKAEREKILN